MANGFTDATPAHKVLEMLLFYSIPRIDTNEIAHRLLEHFGTLANVLDASPEELKKVTNIEEYKQIVIDNAKLFEKQHSTEQQNKMEELGND